jgi:hypothetical protein
MSMPRILAVGTANPPNRFTQAEALALAGYTDERRRGFFLNSGIEGRYLAMEKDGVWPWRNGSCGSSAAGPTSPPSSWPPSAT